MTNLDNIEAFGEFGSSNVPDSIKKEFGEGARKVAVNPFDLVYTLYPESDLARVEAFGAPKERVVSCLSFLISRSVMGEFADKVFDVVSQIPRGKVATYGQVAKLMGRPRSARYVGFALRTNPRPGVDPDSIPCHRVVFSNGSLCKGFAFGGPDVQYRRLLDEGVAFKIACDNCEHDETMPRIKIDGVEQPVHVEDLRVDLKQSQWDGKGYGQAVPIGEPTAPPDDFDWEAEMGE